MMGEEEEKEGSGYLKMTKFGQRFYRIAATDAVTF